MKVEYFGKNYELGDHLKKVSEKKLRKLKKYFSPNSNVKFTVTLEKNTYKTELVVTEGTKVLRAEAESDNPYSNLDVVVPKIEGQMRKKKSLIDKIRRGTSKDLKAMSESSDCAVETDDEADEIEAEDTPEKES